MNGATVSRWLPLSVLVAVLFGAWGALIEIPEKHFQPGFPATLGYVVWSLTMLPCAAVALRRAGWRLDRDRRALWLGMLVGLLGAGGQLAVFRALQSGPAYLVFPILSLSPMVTVALSAWLLRERTHRLAALGVALSIPAFPLLAAQPIDAQQPAGGYAWLAGALAGLLMWGAQAYLIKASSAALSAESLFAYMAVAAVVLAPVAWSMTDTATPINWGLSGPYATALIQSLNSVGALLSIYALRAGKALVVAPTINGLFPGITVVLSLLIYARVPEPWNAVGMVLALVSVALMSYGEALAGQASGISPPPASPVPDDGGAERAARA